MINTAIIFLRNILITLLNNGRIVLRIWKAMKMNDLVLGSEILMSGKQYKFLNSKMNMILQFINVFTGNTSSSFNKVEVGSLQHSHESKVKSLVQRVVTKLHEKIDNNLRTVQFDLTQVCNVARNDMKSLEKVYLSLRSILNSR